MEDFGEKRGIEMRIALMVFGLFIVACDTPPQVEIPPDAGEEEPACDRWVLDICNGVDDDCDGAIDENKYSTQGYGDECKVDLPGMCAEGRKNECVSGELVCIPFYQPGDFNETCDGEDDDCDGFIDEGDPELCNGADDDCDGLIDEDFPGLDHRCVEGIGMCARDGINVCTREKDAVRCDVLPGDPSREACDAEDNDCDGAIDEDVINVGNRCDFLQDGLLCAGTIVCLPVGDDEQQRQACAHLDPPVCQ